MFFWKYRERENLLLRFTDLYMHYACESQEISKRNSFVFNSPKINKEKKNSALALAVN